VPLDAQRISTPIIIEVDLRVKLNRRSSFPDDFAKSILLAVVPIDSR